MACPSPLVGEGFRPWFRSERERARSLGRKGEGCPGISLVALLSEAGCAGEPATVALAGAARIAAVVNSAWRRPLTLFL